MRSLLPQPAAPGRRTSCAQTRVRFCSVRPGSRNLYWDACARICLMRGHGVKVTPPAAARVRWAGRHRAGLPRNVTPLCFARTRQRLRLGRT
jgi:hypothetical protein